jgi:hypothetical protein
VDKTRGYLRNIVDTKKYSFDLLMQQFLSVAVEHQKDIVIKDQVHSHEL